MNYYSDSLTRKLYAQDASMYEQLPMGVAFPKSTNDIVQLVRQANLDRFSITARSAGTSLAGQATGGGVVLDVSRFMTSILEVDSEEGTAKVEPGVIRDTLNREVAQYGLQFGPDTSTTNRCMLGGMIGNNSSGSFSIKYKTTREHVKEMEVVLSDGSVAVFKALTNDELEEKMLHETLEGDIYRGMVELINQHKELIEKSYPHPEIIRRNTGYALDKLCEMEPFTSGGRPFNLCELLCGSEGTLALTTRAIVNLVPVPTKKMLIIPHFKTLEDAMKATVEAVRFKPSAVELVDNVILDATKKNHAQAQNRFFLSGEPTHILIIQFDGDNESIIEKKIERLKDALREKKLCYSYPVVKEEDDQQKVWELRKAGLGLLMGLGKDSRTPAFCEDTAVRVKDLPEYVAEFEEILEKYDTECVFYAHASVGELHLRPMIDTTTEEGVETMKAMASDIADLVHKFGGSLSGEHGDGRARAPFIEQVLGEEMMPVLKEVKHIWDKFNVFNPGKIVDPEPMEDDLRFSPEYVEPDPETVFAWRNEGGMTGVIESCNGAGVCRKLAQSGGTMCPSYMATKDEKDSTRGRANVFRQVFEGKDPEGFASEDLKEALELCLSCKACKSECPANVDMAKMKAEFEHGWHQRNGVTATTRFFANAAKLYPLAAKFPSLSNAMVSSDLGKHMLNVFYSISKNRTLPLFASKPFDVQAYVEPTSNRNKVALFVDVFTRYHHPEIVEDAIKVIEYLGYEVIIPDLPESGRVQISKGMLGDARNIAFTILDVLGPIAEEGIPIIGLEPSELLTLRDEFPDLVDETDLEKAKEIAKSSYLFEEFVFRHKMKHEVQPAGEVIIHNHCHAKVLSAKTTLQKVLENWGYDTVVLDAGCCGMAGSFGYDAKKYEVSMEIGNQRLFPSINSAKKKSNICAPGFSCRHQIKDGTGRNAKHPAQLIASQLPN